MGMLGDNFMTSGVSLEHFQILAAVSTKPQGYLLSDLQQLLPYSQSNLSRFVTRLSAAGYLIKKVDRQDKRRAILKLSAKGKKIWESALSNALDRIGQGLKPLRSNIPKFQSELLQFLDDRI